MRIEEYKIIDRFLEAKIYMRENKSNGVLMQFHDDEIDLINHILFKYKRIREDFENEQIREEYNRLQAECRGEESDF